MSAEKVVLERILIQEVKLVTVAWIGRQREQTMAQRPRFRSLFYEFSSILL